MKSIPIAILTFCLLFANSCKNNYDTDKVEKQLLAEAEARTDRAMRYAELLLADSVLADAAADGSFSYIFSGKHYDRKSAIELLRYAFAQRKSLKFDVLKKMYKNIGEHSVLHTSYCKATITDKSGATETTYFSASWLWEKKNGVWKVKHIHESPMPKLSKLDRAALELVVGGFASELSSKSPVPDNIYSLLKLFLDRHPNIFGSAFAFPEKSNVHKPANQAFYLFRATNGYKQVKISDTFDYTKSDWFAEPVKSGGSYLTAPYFDKGGADMWMITLSFPVYNIKTGELLGVVTGDVLQ